MGGNEGGREHFTSLTRGGGLPQPPCTGPHCTHCTGLCRPDFKHADSQKVGKGPLSIYDALKCRLVGPTVFCHLGWKPHPLGVPLKLQKNGGWGR